MVLALFSLIVPSSYVITMPVCGFYVVFRIVLIGIHLYRPCYFANVICNCVEVKFKRISNK